MAGNLVQPATITHPTENPYLTGFHRSGGRPPGGVGDPDGEYVMAAFAELSGVVALITGAVILVSRGIAVRRSRKTVAPHP